MKTPRGVNWVYPAAFAGLIFSASLVRADPAYYSDGALYTTSGTQNVFGGNITGGNAASSGANYLNGIEQDGGGVNVYGGNISGGTSDNNAAANYLSGFYMIGGTANIVGGSITGGSTANDTFATYLSGIEMIGGTMNIYGGTISAGSATGGPVANHLYGIDAVGGTINIYGGNLSAGTAKNNTFVNLLEGIEAEGGAVDIYGSSFNLPFGAVTEGSGELVGNLANGTPVDVNFEQIHSGEIVLIQTVPENPCMVPLCLLVLICLAGGVYRQRMVGTTSS